MPTARQRALPPTCGTGWPACSNVELDDATLGLVASDDFSPQEARVLLRLALLKPRSLSDMQWLFSEY